MIKTNGLTKYYGKTRGIENLSLSIKQREVFGLLGPNGAGKTTTIRLLMGMLKPTKGTATINGYDCWEKSKKVKQKCGYIPGDVHLYPKETGASLINMFGDIRHNKKFAKELTERLDFDATKKVKALSRGNRQKLAIILALMHKPDVLILDEPTSGLDPLMQHEFYKIIMDFEKEGATVFISSHFLPEVEKVCRKIGIVKEGNLVGIEDVHQIAAKHVKHIEVTFETKPDINKFKKLPQIVAIRHELDNHYNMRLRGDINPVIKALSEEKIKDLALEHATLEEVFLEYYS